MTCHGGAIQTNPRVYVVFWGDWSATGDPDGAKQYILGFLGVLGGSRWLNTTTQYVQVDNQHVGNPSALFAGSYNDTSSNPPSTLAYSDIANEAGAAANHFGDFSANANYVIATPTKIAWPNEGTACAWHSYFTSASGANVPYTMLPYLPDAGASCGSNAVNAGSNGILDGVTIVLGHEIAETMTDPFLNAWYYQNTSGELGDLCAWKDLGNDPNAGGYPTQSLYSNATTACVDYY
jgi:serine protease